MNDKNQDNDTQNDFAFPAEWAVFGPVGKNAPEPDFAGMNDVPTELTIGGERLKARNASFTDNCMGLGVLVGGICHLPARPECLGSADSLPAAG